MSLFPLLVVLLLMALVAELLVIGPRLARSVASGQGFKVSPASARVLLVVVLAQVGLVTAWAVLLRGQPG